MTTPDPRDGPKVCPHCGAKMQEYRHSLSTSLLRALWKFHRRAGRRALNLAECRLTRNEWDNFQKLRYFDLVDQVPPMKRGVWRLTELGEQFLFGEARVRRVAVTYRGARVRFEGDEVVFGEVTGHYQTREEYAAASSPHQEGAA